MERIEGSVWHLRSPWGDFRFYPPGSHPANYREREMRKKLLALPASPQREAALDYLNERIAAFEQGETESRYDVAQRLARSCLSS